MRNCCETEQLTRLPFPPNRPLTITTPTHDTRNAHRKALLKPSDAEHSLQIRQIRPHRVNYQQAHRHHNKSLEPRLNEQDTVEVLEFVTRCFDCAVVIARKVGGWEAGREEMVGRVVQVSHLEKGNKMVRLSYYWNAPERSPDGSVLDLIHGIG